MAKSVPFKFCLLANNGEDTDIRRFDGHPDVLANLTYQRLINLICSTYSNKPKLLISMQEVYNAQSYVRCYENKVMFSLYYIGKLTLTAFFL